MNAFTFDYSRGEDLLHGLFVDRPSHVSYAELADELYNARRSDLSVVNLLIIRPPVDEPLPAEATLKENLAPVFERVPQMSIYLFGSVNFEHKLTDNLNVQSTSVLRFEDVTGLVSHLRQQELIHYAMEANAVLRTSGARIFRAPSGKYCRTFVRVGNVQTNRAAIDGFFFWILPWLKSCGAIVTETWTISTIAMNAARLLSRYSTEAHARIEVDMLSQYHDRTSKLLPDIETVLRRACASTDKTILVLVSSSMSGVLVDSLKATILGMGLPLQRFYFGALYLLGERKDVPHLCDVACGINGATFEFYESPPSEAGESPAIIEIDRRTYFPLRIECAKVDVRGRDASDAAAFVRAYQNSGLISVHRDSFLSNGQRHRHHAVYTDLRKVLSHPRFCDRLNGYLDEILICPRAIVSPPHAAGEALARQVEKYLTEKFQRKVPVFHHLDLQLGEGSSSDPSLLKIVRDADESSSIVLVDDVSVTGRRMSRFQTSLRQLEYSGRIHYIIGIARPERKEDWEKRIIRLRYRTPSALPQNTVQCVEMIVLPDWQEKECPWCQEREFIRLLAKNKRASPACIARLKRLQSAVRQEPMIEDAFFTPDNCVDLRLTKNSLLADKDATQADVFCAVTSILQSMRTNTSATGQSLVSHFPEIHVIDPECYLGSHFNDSIIRAAVLRAAKARELEFPSADDEAARSQLAIDVIKDGASDMHNLSFEIGVATVFHKLPSLLSDQEVVDVVRERGWIETFDNFRAGSEGRHSS